jgi:hypothetical protein
VDFGTMISRRRFHRVFRQGIWRTVRSARQGAPWLADLRAELLSFPAGKDDDQVDALGLVGQLLDKISAGPRPKPPEVPQRDGYRAAFEQMPDDSWKTM